LPYYGYFGFNGKKVEDGTQTTYGTTWGNGDVVGVAFDADNGTLAFYVNGVSQGTAFTGLTAGGPYFFAAGSSGATIVWYANFGQRDFAYDAPTGFKALNTAALPTPAIEVPSDYVGVTTYTGNGGTQSINVGFAPDFVWYKHRAGVAGGSNLLFDTVRGATNALVSNSTGVEVSISNALTSFDSTGFSVGDHSSSNYLDDTYVAWTWKAGGNSNTFNIDDVGYATASAAGLTAGTITPTGASINTTSGFSIITWTGTASNGSIPHGLGKSPSMIIIKNRNATQDWYVQHASRTATKTLYLNTTSAEATLTSTFNNTNPTSNVFTVGTNTGTNGSSNGMIAYCWAEIPGFSKFGSYVGNFSADGPMIVTGFRPRWIMTKASTRASSWYIHDTERGTYNPIGPVLAANSSATETSPTRLDILSNGFKIRDNDTEYNASGDTYIYAAFAETPFSTQARAR